MAPATTPQTKPRKRSALGQLTPEQRLQRDRDRNRDHARRTRQRKKALLKTLQARVSELQAAAIVLERALQDASATTMLLGLAGGRGGAALESFSRMRRAVASNDLAAAMAARDEDDDEAPRALGAPHAADVPQSAPRVVDAKQTSYETLRQAVEIAASVRLTDGLSRKPTPPGSPRHVGATAVYAAGNAGADAAAANANADASGANADGAKAPLPLFRETVHWKGGFVVAEDGSRRNVSETELSALRRERNRVHAQMTRGRKKVYIETLSRAIKHLEQESKRARRLLAGEAEDDADDLAPAADDARVPAVSRDSSRCESFDESFAAPVPPTKRARRCALASAVASALDDAAVAKV